jgi:flagellar secretion chaperone FliS
MNPLLKYKQQQVPSWTRIDMLLALYDGAIDRMEKGIAAIKRNEPRSAKPFLFRSVLIVNELANGLDFKYGELPLNHLRLYEFVTRSLDSMELDKVEAALGVMRVLREGLRGIQAEATELERSGQIPPIGATHRLQMLA